MSPKLIRRNTKTASKGTPERVAALKANRVSNAIDAGARSAETSASFSHARFFDEISRGLTKPLLEDPREMPPAQTSAIRQRVDGKIGAQIQGDPGRQLIQPIARLRLIATPAELHRRVARWTQLGHELAGQFHCQLAPMVFCDQGNTQLHGGSSSRTGIKGPVLDERR